MEIGEFEEHDNKEEHHREREHIRRRSLLQTVLEQSPEKNKLLVINTMVTQVTAMQQELKRFKQQWRTDKQAIANR